MCFDQTFAQEWWSKLAGTRFDARLRRKASASRQETCRRPGPDGRATADQLGETLLFLGIKRIRSSAARGASGVAAPHRAF